MSLLDVLGDILLPWNWGSFLTDTDKNARMAYDFWEPKTRLDIHWASIMGGIEGEDSFRPELPGDHGMAFGIAQWWPARRGPILKHTGIDVTTAPMDQQLLAQFWEMTDPKSEYSHILTALNLTTTLWQANTLLVKEYEKSAMPGRDITRRVALSQGWLDTAAKQGWPRTKK